MPASSRTSFKKRQKEQERKERNQQKLARRQQRKENQPVDAAMSDGPDVAAKSGEDSGPGLSVRI